MVTAHEQLDRRFAKLKPLIKEAARPPRGWIRAIREALGRTTGQLAERLGVRQPRVVELEHGEGAGNITVKSLERAAQALGCRLVYILVPEEALAETIRKRASVVAERQLASVEQTMRLEAQGVHDKTQHQESHQPLVDKLMRRPAARCDHE